MKRAFDFAIAISLLVVLLPILATIAIAVRCALGRPILFRQQRPGKDGVPFELIKFRTMKNATERGGLLLSDEARLTKFGRFLRASSIDELPELINVVRGEMSLVGPRPLLMDYLDRYTERQHRRHEALPGITGWAQVNGRNSLSWDEKFEMDVWYVDNRSFGLDCRILFKTVLTVISRKGVSADGHATMTRFGDDKQVRSDAPIAD